MGEEICECKRNYKSPLSGICELCWDEKFPDEKETLEEAADRWVFETNGHKWSNNDDTAGDNFGSFKAGAEWQAERMVTKEAYESTQTMIKASNEGFLSKINELEEKVKRMYSEEDFKLFARQYYREIKLDKSNLLWDDLADKCLEQFKKK